MRCIGKLIIGVLFLAAVFISPVFAYAQDQGMQQGQGQQRTPPQEAITACSGMSEGTSCQVQGPQGAINGTCGYTPDKKYFVCKPAR